MKKWFLTLLWLAAANDYIQAKDLEACTNHYFKNKKVATSECWDKAHKIGVAKAYNAKGAIIYEKELRKVGGHSTVRFTYYASGAVKRAAWRSVPNGGIQWYSSVTTFSEDGKVTDLVEDDYEKSPANGRLNQKPGKGGVRDSARTTKAPVTHISEFWYINATPYPVVIEATKDQEHYTATLKPGEKAKGGQVLLPEFDKPDKYFRFTVRPANVKEQKKLVMMPSEKKPKSAGKQRRIYYYEVHRTL